MKWANLKDNRCPKCGDKMINPDVLMGAGKSSQHLCSSEDCDFVCSDNKFNEIIKSLYLKSYKEPDRSGWDI